MSYAKGTNNMSLEEFRQHLEDMHDTYASPASTCEALQMIHERQHKDADLEPLYVDHVHRNDIG